MKGDTLASGGISATFLPSGNVSQEKWDMAFGKKKTKVKTTVKPKPEPREDTGPFDAR